MARSKASESSPATSARACSRHLKKTTWRSGCATGSEGVSIRFSSRPILRRSGVCLARRSKRSGQLSEFEGCRSRRSYATPFSREEAKGENSHRQVYYPELGPGQMWETLTGQLTRKGYPVLMERPVVRVCHGDGRITHVVTGGPEAEEKFKGTHFISSMPIRELINALNPQPPETILRAANDLRYRDFLIVSLIIKRKYVTPDNWIYVHEPGVKVGRIQNFKNWSPAMVPDPARRAWEWSTLPLKMTSFGRARP